MEPPTITLRVDDSRLEIDTGELIFPLLVLMFCLAYYLDTRGLPEKSMMYAEPLLYVTGLLALTTMLTEAIEFKARRKGEYEVNQNSSRFIEWSSVDAEAPSQELQAQEDILDADQVRIASGLVVILAIYIGSLYVVPFTLATAGVLASSLYLLGERNLPKIAIYSLVFTLITWAVFLKWLLIPLP